MRRWYEYATWYRDAAAFQLTPVKLQGFEGENRKLLVWNSNMSVRTRFLDVSLHDGELCRDLRDGEVIHRDRRVDDWRYLPILVNIPRKYDTVRRCDMRSESQAHQASVSRSRR